MGMFDRLMETANQVKDAAMQTAAKTTNAIKTGNEEAKERGRRSPWVSTVEN